MGVDGEYGRVVSGCAFCEIVAGRAPASLVAEDRLVVAFVDRRQALLGHVLVVPRRHIPSICNLDEETGAAVMALAVRVARALHSDFAQEGLSLWQSNGAAAFQEVPHLHIHVHPRRNDDGLLRVYPAQPAEASRAALDALAARIRATL